MTAEVRPSNEEDAALLRRVASGDEHALGVRYDRWSPLVFSSQSEIAERTGQPLGTNTTRVRLAMEKLRDRRGSLRERES